jgi:hypothetical protein
LWVGFLFGAPNLPPLGAHCHPPSRAPGLEGSPRCPTTEKYEPVLNGRDSVRTGPLA